MKGFFLAVLTYAAMVLDTGCGSWSVPTSAMPQFLYLTAAVAALTYRGTGAVLWAVVTGLLADVVHGGPLGLHVVLLANLTFLSQLGGARKSRNSLVTSAAFILLYVAIAGFGGLILREAFAGRAMAIGPFTNVAVSRAGGTVAVYLLVMTTWRVMRRSLRISPVFS